MEKLTDKEIASYIKDRNCETGVDGISREDLEKIDLDSVSEITICFDLICDAKTGKQLYKLDRFTPRAGTYAFNPSFAGRQMILGKIGRKLYFSNGVWFIDCC
jgi:hypothetical protein